MLSTLHLPLAVDARFDYHSCGSKRWPIPRASEANGGDKSVISLALCLSVEEEGTRMFLAKLCATFSWASSPACHAAVSRGAKRGVARGGRQTRQRKMVFWCFSASRNREIRRLKSSSSHNKDLLYSNGNEPEKQSGLCKLLVTFCWA